MLSEIPLNDHPPIEALLMFVRYPEPGRAKTRLIPAVGPEMAASLYREMVGRVAGVVRAFDREGLRRVACYEPAAREKEVAEWLGEDFCLQAQPEGDLGCRLQNGFLKAFRDGARRVVAIGTDCVEITSEILAEAFDALSEVDASIGPAMDGGYYLIGLSRPCRNVFRGIPWSTDRTMLETLARLRSCGLRFRILPPLHDIDTPEDLQADCSGLLI